MGKASQVIGVVALALAGVSSASANNDVQFIGAVTAITCDLEVIVNGQQTKLIDLGTVAPSSIGTPVNFALKAKLGEPGCASLIDAKTAVIGWGGGFSSTGLPLLSGSAVGSEALIATVNAEGTPVQAINSTRLSTNVLNSALKGDGAKYTATLKSSVTPGDYHSAVTYVAAYQ